MIKIVSYTTVHETDKKIDLEIEIKSKYNSSKKILEYLENNVNLDLIHSIQTKEFIKIVEFTTINETEVKTVELKSSLFKTSKDIFDYLSTNFDLDLIHSITKKVE